MFSCFRVFFVFILFNLVAQNSPVLERYEFKYYLGKDLDYQTDGTMLVRNNKIEVYQGSRLIRTFPYSSVETITNQVDTNVSFQYDYYHIYNSDIDRIVISKRKEVKKNGIFYYRVVIGNKTYLAL